MYINNYLSIAKNDYRYLSRSIEEDINDYPSNVAIGSQQVCEKCLKFLLEQFCYNHSEVKRLLRTHDLVIIYDALIESGIDLGIDDSALAILKNYYFNARYPGDDFMCVSVERARRAYETATEVKDKVENYLLEHGYCANCGSKLLETGECPTSDYCSKYNTNKRSKLDCLGKSDIADTSETPAKSNIFSNRQEEE